MENREQQILSEIKSMMGTIRTQLELLDAKMAELQQCVDPEEFDNNPIELDLDEIEVVDDDLPFDDPAENEVDEAEDVAESEPEVEAEAEAEFEAEAETEVVTEEAQESECEAEAEDIEEEEDEDDDLPGVFDQPVTVYQAAQSSPKAKPSVAEAMTEKQAWRTDIPGTSVKDVRSAISLNDRIIFINYLFDEDPMSFQASITKINTMQTLDEVVEYVSHEHPTWDLSSELVYRFMMAVRRRVK